MIIWDRPAIAYQKVLIVGLKRNGYQSQDEGTLGLGVIIFCLMAPGRALLLLAMMLWTSGTSDVYYH